MPTAAAKSVIARIIDAHHQPLLEEWVREQLRASSHSGKIKEGELRQQCAEFMRLLAEAMRQGDGSPIEGAAWQPVKEMLADVSRTRTAQGFSPSDIAVFVFSFKRPLFERLRRELGGNVEALSDETWTATELLDRLGLYTTEVYQNARESLINRQQQEMLELSTPVVKLWDGILALPMIGTLDSNRTQVVMETLLRTIVDTGSQIAIIDITGVPTVDTLVAQHLLKTVSAAKLMGADCIISGIRPQIAQTIVHLGIELGGVTTKATLADALKEGLRRVGTELHPLAAMRQG